MPQILLECVPAFRLGLTVESLSEVLCLSEAGQNMPWLASTQVDLIGRGTSFFHNELEGESI